jgi:uncharacterized cupredoxin-like copper-binding protein
VIRIVPIVLFALVLAACTSGSPPAPVAAMPHEHTGHGATASPTSAAPASAPATAHRHGAVDTDGVVEITMTDAMRFEPGEITIEAGQSVRIVVHNVGLIPHEAVLGTLDEQRHHAAEMAAGEAHYHSNGVLVEPGATGEFETWFPAGQYLIACHLPGHYQAGMVGVLNVVDG